MMKFSIISLLLTKLYVISHYSEIRQNFSNSVEKQNV